ncbi:hypothetical protein DPMN_096529 [Dreissena polymorpha]|uniref:Uncharacterized protein n=1 Tax=Dreissena polymorpha TaxID=45954 RepID=A0A9D4LBJ1_DREPO|nr:hypothetical protein DPMN_096529 [Dreissena polymorpha]
MKHRLCPEYLSNLIPLNPQNRRDLRNNDSVPLIHARSESYRCSFVPTAICEWNALTPDLQQSPTLASFKASLSRNQTKSSELFNNGSRVGQILHALNAVP